MVNIETLTKIAHMSDEELDHELTSAASRFKALQDRIDSGLEYPGAAVRRLESEAGGALLALWSERRARELRR